jgi:ABC-type lipoprotein release transport system permease subunit
MKRLRRTFAITAVGVGALTVAAGCGSTSNSSAPSAAAMFYGSTIQVTASDGQPTLEISKIDEIKRVDGVKTAFAAYRFDADTGKVETDAVTMGDSIVAVDPTESAWSGLKTVYAQGHAIDADSSGEVVLGSRIASELNKKIGDTVDLPLHPGGSATSHSFSVAGILGVTHTAPDLFAYVNIADGQLLLRDATPAAQRDELDVAAVATVIDVYAKPGTSIAELDSIADRINKQVTGVKASKPSQVVASVGS